MAVLLVVFLAVGAFIWDRSQTVTGTPERVYVSQCRSELNRIERAKTTWAAEHPNSTNDPPTWADLVGAERYLKWQRSAIGAASTPWAAWGAS